jgi:hypothetical protein
MRAEKGFSSVFALVLVTAILLGSIAFVGISTGRASGSGSPENVFYVLVNSNVYSPLASYLNRYAQDLKAEGLNAQIYSATWSTPEAVRAVLQSAYASGLVGALFVGDIPVAWYKGNFPTDFFYMDLNGTWIDSNSDGVYDNRAGNLAPEIYVGRLKASGMSGDEVSLLQNYFAKNHAYRTGTLTLPQRALIYIDDPFVSCSGVIDSELSSICGDRVIENDPITTSKDDYLSRLREGWTLVYLTCHSGPCCHCLSVGGEEQYVWWSDIRSTDPRAFFYSLDTCFTANYTVADYIGGWYIFSNTYGLAATGQTSPGTTLSVHFYHRLENESLGEAYRDYFLEYPTHDDDLPNRVILGDPTFRLPVAWSQPSDDAWVEAEYPGSNHGSDVKLAVRANDPGYMDKSSYLKFSLSRIPPDAIITSAKLWLYCYDTVGTYNEVDASGVVSDSWSESTLTYSNAPGIFNYLDFKFVNVANKWYSWDVTSWVKTQFQGDKVVSICMNPGQPGPGDSGAQYFCSKEAASRHPYLEIIYTMGAEVNLVSGWNLVCFTAVGASDTPKNMFSPLNYYTDYIIYYWLAPGGPYQIQDPDTVFKDNIGYWVYINTAKTVTTSGTRPASRDIHLVAGWNIVSFPVINAHTTPNNLFAPLGYLTDYVIYWWNAPGGPYGMQDLDTPFKDNLGYWIYINQDKIVTAP